MGLYREPLSQGGEVLISELRDRQGTGHPRLVVDVVVVGSGYGGAVAAARLAELPKQVYVLERGLEYLPGSFPDRFADLPGHVRVNRFDTPELTGDPRGLFDFRIGADITTLVGNGLGGGSLINASVAEKPDPQIFKSNRWPEKLQDIAALEEHYGTAREMLGVGPAKIEGLAKYREFETWARGIDLEPRPADVAVSFSDLADNGHGVEQHACIRCGDCVTGCNYNAKNTLAMNYLARAKRSGARLFTGVTVAYLEHEDKDSDSDSESLWAVNFRLTARAGFATSARNHRIFARHVVLAAGSFGSTEILMRSGAHGLPLSKALGSKFSCNGDMISVLYDQARTVNAAPRESKDVAQRNVGPTITGIACRGGARDQRLTIEELAIPAALRRIFEEVVTTTRLPYRLGRFDFDVHGPGGLDPAAVDDGAIDRTQIFAAMGEDGAEGVLELIAGEAGVDSRKVADGAIAVKWLEAGKDPVYARQEACMALPTENGGEYLPNPLWRPLPEDLAGKLSGRKPDGKLFTVHPLGGCPMADDARDGVVNDIGEVFSVPEGDDVHPGLLVLDGSIVPASLGINPLLTITALAERAIGIYIRKKITGCDSRPAAVRTVPMEVAPPPPVAALEKQEEPTALRFSERVEGCLTRTRDGSQLPVELTLNFDEERDVPGFLRDASRRLRIRSAELAVTLPASGQTRRVRVSGDVALLERCKTTAFERVRVGLGSFLRQRGIADWLHDRRAKRRGQATWMDEVLGRLLWIATPAIAFLAGVLTVILGALQWRWSKLGEASGLLGFVRLASQVGEVRRLAYALTLEAALELDGETLPPGTRIEGEKILRYTQAGNPWIQLFELPVAVLEPKPGKSRFAAGTLTVNLGYFFRRYATLLQITRQRDLPASLVDFGSLLLFLGRILGKIHFWSFRLPEYQRHDPAREERRKPAALPGLMMERYYVYPDHGKTSQKLMLPLFRYWKEGAPAGNPVLLIHGLGSGGIQFATPRLKTNLVQHLARQGREVWVAELRHSIAVGSSREQWTLDEIALGDLRPIFDEVLLRSGKQKVDVVAHCIGSAMFCIAALKGRLDRDPARPESGSLVNSAVLMQVGPLITLSAGTKVRAYLAAFLRRYMREDFVDFSVDTSADWIDSMVDRLLTTYPYPESEAAHHRLYPPWKPHTHIANCNRWAAIDGRMIQHENLDETMLESLGEILGHANITTWDQTIQYAFLERLTDSEARNSYVTHKNIDKHFKFPVRFIHGTENDVFLVETSKRSCELLKKVFGEGHPCDVKEIRGYSHLDPLIGRRAYLDVYPFISEFLSTQQAGKSEFVPAELDVKRPLIGPIVGWTRKNGRWAARVWCRVDDTSSPCSFLVAVPLKNGSPLWDRIVVPPPTTTRIDTLAAFDVDLDADEAKYEIVVASAHPWGWRQAADPKTLAGMPRQHAEEALRKYRARLAGDEERTCDPNYETKLDSVILEKDVLAGLADSNRIRFALGSCRYGSTVIDRERADATFGGLRRLVKAGRAAGAPSMLLLVGDQIYSDQTAGVFDHRGRRERFYEAYREAWTAPNAREVLRRLPTYMILDDHEIGDNWHPMDHPDPWETELRKQGLQAFQEYQLLHSPRPIDGVLDAPPRGGFGYPFDAAGFHFFVCDTRTGRDAGARIMHDEQFKELAGWLKCQQEKHGDRPKFVVSSSLVAPYSITSGPHPGYAPRSDGWDGYPESLRALFRVIWESQIDNVVFLCGDAHLSMASRISFTDKDGNDRSPLRAYCIVSSPMYAPYPFANARIQDYLRDNLSRLREVPVGEDLYMRYQIVDGSHFPRDNFSVVDVESVQNKWSIRLRQYAPSGEPQEVTLKDASVESLETLMAKGRLKG